MNKSMKPSRPAGKAQVAPLTPEEQQEKIIRFLSQKRESIATGVLYNVLHNPEILKADVTPESLAEYAVEIADKMIEVLYPLKEDSEVSEE